MLQGTIIDCKLSFFLKKSLFFKKYFGEDFEPTEQSGRIEKEGERRVVVGETWQNWILSRIFVLLVRLRCNETEPIQGILCTSGAVHSLGGPSYKKG